MSIPEILDKLKKHKDISSLNVSDISIIKSFVSNSPEGSYADTWAYLTQTVHMEGYGHQYGLKYYDGERFLVLGVFNRPYKNDMRPHALLVRPLGNWSNIAIKEILSFVYNIIQTPVYLAKINNELFYELKTDDIIDAYQYPWHEDAPLEDDTYPEQIVDLELMKEAITSKSSNELKKKLNQYKAHHEIKFETSKYYAAENFKNSSTIIKQFFSEKYPKHHGISAPSDYSNMLEMKEDIDKGVHIEIVKQDKEPIGFFLAERTSCPKTVGIYANIVLYKDIDISGISEMLLLSFLIRLHELDYKYANLGGSEKRGLHDFKNKFTRDGRGSKFEMKWAVYNPNVNGKEIPNKSLSPQDIVLDKPSGPQSQAMFILINVILGISLWQALVSFSNSNTTSISFVPISLFVITSANLLRTFLGFVSFEVNKGLADRIIREYTNRIDHIRLIDFLLGVFAATLLIPLSMNCNNHKIFGIYFIIISLIFVIRNFIIWRFYRYALYKSNPDSEIIPYPKDIIIYSKDIIIHPFLANLKIVKTWFYVDLAILGLSIAFYFVIGTSLKEISAIIAFCIFIIMGWEIIWNSRYYFSGGVSE